MLTCVANGAGGPRQGAIQCNAKQRWESVRSVQVHDVDVYEQHPVSATAI